MNRVVLFVAVAVIVAVAVSGQLPKTRGERFRPTEMTLVKQCSMVILPRQHHGDFFEFAKAQKVSVQRVNSVTYKVCGGNHEIVAKHSSVELKTPHSEEHTGVIHKYIVH
jgi:hypothetical protein